MKSSSQPHKSSPRVAWVENQVARRYSNARILDVGFMGRYAKPGLHLALRQKNARAKVIGLDINVERVLQIGLPNTLVGDATAIAARDASFDAVLCLEMLEHLFSPMLVLREFERVLRPGGELMITTPNAWSWSNFVRNWLTGSLSSRARRGVYRHYLGDADHKQFYDPLSLMSLLDYAGFDPAEIVTKNHAIPLLRRYSNAFELMDLKFYPLNRLGHYVCLIARKRAAEEDNSVTVTHRAPAQATDLSTSTTGIGPNILEPTHGVRQGSL
jgi:SAM-dependent methyltransferase